MRKKFIFLVIFVAVLIMLGMPGPVFAKDLFFADNPSQLAVAEGATLIAGEQIVTGQCNVQSITFGGPLATATSYVKVYDGTDATGTPKFDIAVGVAATITHINLNDAEFGTGIFVQSNISQVAVTIAYTQ